MNGADAVAIKALTQVFQAWKLGGERAAKLAGMSERTRARMQVGTWSGTLSQDQTLRASALVGLYKGLHLYFGDDLADRWVSLANRGPLFGGSAPVDVMVAGGLPAITDARDYIGAVRGGAGEVTEGAESTERDRPGVGRSAKPTGEAERDCGPIHPSFGTRP